MSLRMWRFVTLVFASLSMAMAFSHLLQMPPRMSYDAFLWRSTQSIYRLYGPPIGAILESGAWMLSLFLCYLVRRRGPAFRWTLLGASCFVVAQVVWWVFIFPVNSEMVNWTVQSMPADWADYRLQWECTHAARAVIQIVGLAALFLSMLIETPAHNDSARL